MTEVPAALRPRLVANVSLMFAELPLAERLQRVRDAGVRLVEMWWPFSSPDPSPREVAALIRSVDRAGVDLVAMNLYGGNPTLGDRGVLCLAGYGEALSTSVRAAVEVARETGCALFNVPFGAAEDDAVRSRDRAVSRLDAITAQLVEVGGTALVEPLTGLPGLSTAREAVTLLEELRARGGPGNVGYLLDVYHAVNNGEDPVGVVAKHAGWIRHVQLADAPGRGRPGTGGIDFGEVFRALERAGYEGLVSLEHVTRETDLDSAALAALAAPGA